MVFPQLLCWTLQCLLTKFWCHVVFVEIYSQHAFYWSVEFCKNSPCLVYICKCTEMSMVILFHCWTRSLTQLSSLQYFCFPAKYCTGPLPYRPLCIFSWKGVIQDCLVLWRISYWITVLTRPSILCVTHNKRYWLVHGGTGSVWGGSGWYLVVLGQYGPVPFSIKLYLVSKVLLCLYILEKVEIWSGVTDARHTHSLTDNRI